MNTNQQKYTAFMESVCKEFNCPEMLPALTAGFKAFCEAVDTDVTGALNYVTNELNRALPSDMCINPSGSPNPNTLEVALKGERNYQPLGFVEVHPDNVVVYHYTWSDKPLNNGLGGHWDNMTETTINLNDPQFSDKIVSILAPIGSHIIDNNKGEQKF